MIICSLYGTNALIIADFDIGLKEDYPQQIWIILFWNKDGKFKNSKLQYTEHIFDLWMVSEKLI